MLIINDGRLCLRSLGVDDLLAFGLVLKLASLFVIGSLCSLTNALSFSAGIRISLVIGKFSVKFSFLLN